MLALTCVLSPTLQSLQSAHVILMHCHNTLVKSVVFKISFARFILLKCYNGKCYNCLVKVLIKLIFLCLMQVCFNLENILQVCVPLKRSGRCSIPASLPCIALLKCYHFCVPFAPCAELLGRVQNKAGPPRDLLLQQHG